MAKPGLSVDDPLTPSKDLASDTSKNSGVVTFKPFTPGFCPSKPLPQRNRRNKRTNLKFVGNEENEILPGLFEPTSYSKYLTLKFDDKRVEDSDMFTICKEITTICRREPKMSFQNDGSLLIEAISPEESEKLQSLELITGIKANCIPHKSMNRCRGVVRSRYLMKYSEERLLEEFKCQKVVDVKQMMKKIDGVLTPLPTYLITFDLIRLPRELKAAWLRLEVRPYIPSPRRCFYCQRFGHVSDSCRRKLKGEKRICNNCGQEDHGNCDNPSFCVNCTGSHPASSKSCERYLLEREIQTIRSKEHVTFQEAKKRVMTQFIRPGVSFASILSKSRKASTPEKSNSSPVDQNYVSLGSAASIAKSKRRRSIEEQDASPSCKSNRFEVLVDEVDCDVLDTESMKLDDDLSASGLDVTPALARSVVRAEVHTSACSAERVDASALAGLGEPAGASALAGLGEPAGALSPVGSGESAGEMALAGLGKSSEAESLTMCRESAVSFSVAGSLDQVGDSKNNSFNGGGSQIIKKNKTPIKGTADGTKTALNNHGNKSNTDNDIIPNRKMKVVNSNKISIPKNTKEKEILSGKTVTKSSRLKL